MNTVNDSRGVLYYNRGTRCLIRLLVSLHSLRAHYPGPVCIVNEGEPPAWFRAACESFHAWFRIIEPSPDYVLMRKSQLWRDTPFKLTMFLDSDTLVRGPIDEFFVWTEKHGCVVTRFNDWHTHRGRMRRRIESWRRACPELIDDALQYGGAINTGIQGWAAGAPILPAYEKTTRRGLEKGGMQKKMLDELAMQLLLPKYKHFLAPSEWNVGCLHGKPDGARIIHYHGSKHCRKGEMGDLWKTEFMAVCEMFPELKQELLDDPDDDNVKLWLLEKSGRRTDLTIVTAVNPLYAEAARVNLERWLNTPGLKEQQFIVFVNGFRRAEDRKFLNRPNVRVIRWDYRFPDASPRETMLASFILGTAEHVRTQFWMKLDCDTHPTKDRFEWPAYDRFDITSHKWGFTKMKGDPNPSEHWFTKLDRIMTPEAPLFRRQPLDPKTDLRVGHRRGNPWKIPMRFASFAHIERTELTKRIAKLVNDRCGGRLPIPSHDTLVWHCATAWKKKVQLVNFKEWFRP